MKEGTFAASIKRPKGKSVSASEGFTHLTSRSGAHFDAHKKATLSPHTKLLSPVPYPLLPSP